MTDSVYLKRLGKKIKQRRLKENLSQQNLVSMTGLSISTIATIEQGRANPSLDALSKIASALGISLANLLG